MDLYFVEKEKEFSRGNADKLYDFVNKTVLAPGKPGRR